MNMTSLIIEQATKHKMQGAYAKYGLCMNIFLQKLKSVYSPLHEQLLDEAYDPMARFAWNSVHTIQGK